MEYYTERVGRFRIVKQDTFKVVGCNPNSSRGYNVINIRRVSDNKTFVCKARTVQNNLVA